MGLVQYGRTAERLSVEAFQVKHVFDQVYFHGGAKVGGYAGSGYADFPIHHFTARKILELKPESVLEIGCARGYVLRRLEDQGVRVKGLEISEHCYLTRAIADVVTWDVTKAPWPIEDKSFDLCVSIAALEHIAEEHLPTVFSEMARTCKRGLHGIDLHDDDHFDKTHCSIHPEQWWKERLPEGHVGVDKESLEAGPASPPQETPGKPHLVKLNLGSFTNQFHYGWRNLDRIDLAPWARQQGYSFSCVDVTQGLPYDDEIVDAIFSSHMLEHVSYEQALALMKDCHRVMKPGTVIRVVVPDAGKLIKSYHDNFLGYFDEMSSTSSARSTQAGKLWELLLGDEHRAIYDWDTLERLFLDAGFKDPKQERFRHSRSPIIQTEATDMYADLSLFGEATR
jgi:cyclopropane fatty-acyl-phospholipid synthase-like methyltransferase